VHHPSQDASSERRKWTFDADQYMLVMWNRELFAVQPGPNYSNADGEYVFLGWIYNMKIQGSKRCWILDVTAGFRDAQHWVIAKQNRARYLRQDWFCLHDKSCIHDLELTASVSLVPLDIFDLEVPSVFDRDHKEESILEAFTPTVPR